MGRTAKRSADIHLRNAMSRPRVATTIRRVTSVLNSISDIPAINFTAEKPDLHLPISQRAPELPESSRPVSPALFPPKDVETIQRSASPPIDPPDQKVIVDSATESEEDVRPHPRASPLGKGKAAIASRSPSAGPSAKSLEPQSIRPSRNASPLLPKQSKETPSDSDSSPVRPVKKKLKQIPSSDDDSEAERRKRARGGAPAKRGTRQPLKRGGKRF